MRARRAARVLAQRVADVGTSQLDRRQQARQHAGRGGDGRGKERRAHVHGGVGEPELVTQGIRDEADQQRAEWMRDGQADRGADGREHQALDQHLPDLSTPLRAERGPHGDLLGPPDAARQQQVGDVGRREHQQQYRRGHQRQRGAGGVADQRFADRRHGEADAAIHDRPHRLGARRDAVEVGLRLAACVTPGDSRANTASDTSATRSIRSGIHASTS